MEIEVAGILIGFFVIAVIALIPVVKTIMPIFPYAYVNARLRAMKNILITNKEFEEFLMKPYNEIIYQLEKKHYVGLSKFIGADFSYGSVEAALRSSMIRTLAKVKRMTPDDLNKFISALVAKYDLQLIESLIRSSKTKAQVRRDALHITEVFSDEFLAKKEHSVDELFNELKGTMYEETLRKHLSDLKQGTFLGCELELDTLFYKRLLQQAKTPLARKYVKKLIDQQNISMTLKGLAPIIEGGRIPLELLDPKAKLQDVAKKIQPWHKGDFNTAEELEKQIQLDLKKFGESLKTNNPLSEATVIGFLILKTVNVRNLNILLKLKYHDYPEEEIKKVLAL